MMRPDDKRQKGDSRSCKHHRRVSKERLTRKGWDDLRNNAKGRQNQDIDLGMPKKPEDMLEHNWVTTPGWIEKRRAKMTVCKKHGHGACQHRHRGNQQKGCNHPCPNKERHLHERHTRGAHVHNSCNDINGPEDRRHS